MSDSLGHADCSGATVAHPQPVLDGVEAVNAADNQWFGDMMILQVLADSENVNDQEREVLARWLGDSVPPSQRTAGAKGGA
jgi:hypothetical protein